MMTSMTLDVIARLPGYRPHIWTEHGLIVSRHSGLFVIPDLALPSPVLIDRIPWRLTQNLARVRLVDRALRWSIQFAHPGAAGDWLVANDSGWWLVGAHRKIASIPRFSGTRPMQRGACTGAGGSVYIADYLGNADRSLPVRVHRTQDLRHFDIAWQFDPGLVRHVHALIRSPNDNRRIWVLTGDRDSESCILYTDDEFASVHTFLAQGQQTRATDLIERHEQVIWGMDSPSTPPWIMSAPREDPDSVRAVCRLPGPAYYLSQNEAGAVYVGTTVEPGVAVSDRCGHVLGLRPDGAWREVSRRRKDAFPQHGMFLLPSGVLPSDYFVHYQRALRPDEGCMLITRDRDWPE